jgi:hypothetical protein
VYWGFGIIYIALCVAFIADVFRNRTLSTGGKIAWTLALIFVPVASWCIYGVIRMSQSRGL